MTKLRCVPVEDLEALQAQRDIFEGNSEGALDEIEHRVKNMLAVAPPPPPDIAEALELAKDYATEMNETVWEGIVRNETVEEFSHRALLARALIKSWGRDA